MSGGGFVATLVERNLNITGNSYKLSNALQNLSKSAVFHNILLPLFRKRVKLDQQLKK